MSLVFSWTPDDGDAPWAAGFGGSAGVTHYVDGLGCEGAKALTCAPAGFFESFLSKQLTAGVTVAPAECYANPMALTPLRACTIRWQWGYLAPTPSSDLSILSFQNWVNGNADHRCFWGSLDLFQATGQLRLNIRNTDTTNALTALGVLPADGVPHGFQLALTFIDYDTVAYTLAIDDTVVLSGTATHDPDEEFPCLGQWGSAYVSCVVPGDGNPCNVFIPHSGISTFQIAYFSDPAGSGGCQVNGMSVVGPVEVDDIASIISYPACAGTTPIAVDQCCDIPPDITNVTYDCDLHRLTIAGSHFTESGFIEVIGPEDLQTVETTIISLAPDQIVAEVDPPLVTGATYCVTAHA